MIILKKSLNLWNGQKLLKYKTVRDTKEIGALKRIASFCVDHDQLDRGMYISRIDGDVITYDIRMKNPTAAITSPIKQFIPLSICLPHMYATPPILTPLFMWVQWAAVLGFTF